MAEREFDKEVRETLADIALLLQSGELDSYLPQIQAEIDKRKKASAARATRPRGKLIPAPPLRVKVGSNYRLVKSKNDSYTDATVRLLAEMTDGGGRVKIEIVGNCNEEVKGKILIVPKRALRNLGI